MLLAWMGATREPDVVTTDLAKANLLVWSMEETARSLGCPHLGDVDVKEPDGIGLELLVDRSRTLLVRSRVAADSDATNQASVYAVRRNQMASSG